MLGLNYCEIAYLTSYIAIISLTGYLYIHKPASMIYGYAKNILCAFAMFSIALFLMTALSN